MWEPPGKPISVRLSLDVVDRMLQDVMRGFGAVPKRGAEVGGILLGRTANAEKTIVTIDDYELMPIEYKRSPSWLLSEEDARTFEGVLERARNNANPLLRPVGFFRSHTRDGVGLGPEDLAIMGLHFPEPEAVALIIRPYATRVGQAGFYFRENGEFQTGLPLLEFPFRRRDLDPDGTPPSRATRPGDRQSLQTIAPSRHEVGRATLPRPAPEPVAAPPPEAPAAPVAVDSKPRPGGAWVWVPLSFIFLLLGVLLGFQAALSMRPQLPAGSNVPYNLNVTVTRSGSNLQIKWDRQALAIRSAQKGLLTIEDGTYSKPVPLNAFDLQSGSVVYPPYSDHVRLRLDVIVNDRDTLTETVDWRQ